MTQDELVKGTHVDELLEIKEELNKAKEDTTPFPVIKDGEVSVIGDANKIQPKSADYTVRFRFLKSNLKEYGLENISTKDIVLETSQYVIVDVEYKNVDITPQRHLEAMSNIAKIMPYYLKINEKGEVEEYTREEQIEVLSAMDRDVIGAMYNLVGWLLDVKEKWIECIMFESLTDNMKKLIQNNPEVFNASELFS